MPGMLAVRVRPPVFFSEGADPSHLVGRSYRVTEVRESTVHCAGEAFPKTLLDFAPDLTDPATLGCLLALVREAHGQSTLSPVMIGRNRWCLADFGTTALEGDTEAALLVAALKAAADRSGGAP